MKSSLGRRTWLKLSAVAAAALTLRVLPERRASSLQPETNRRWAMVIDQGKCLGCGYCVQACRAHNDIPPEITWNPVLPAGEVNGKPTFLPRPCMHCEHAPCVDVCPVGASFYRPDGIVAMNYDLCIGCRYCEAACPYAARSFNWEAFTGPNPAVPQWGQPEVERRPRGVPEKCSFCSQRIDRGLSLGLTPGVDDEATPACVVACPAGARAFGDLNDPLSPVSVLLRQNVAYRLREDLGTSPRVYYLAPSKETE